MGDSTNASDMGLPCSYVVTCLKHDFNDLTALLILVGANNSSFPAPLTLDVHGNDVALNEIVARWGRVLGTVWGGVVVFNIAGHDDSE